MTRVNKKLLAVATLSLLVTVATAKPIVQPSYDFNLPQQSLADALRAIGRQTTMNILFEPTTVENLWAPAVHGLLSPQEAIRRALAGTKLVVEQTASNSLLIAPAPQASISDTGTTDVHATRWAGAPLRLAQADSPQSTESTASPSPTESKPVQPSTGPVESKVENEVIITGSRIARPDLDRLQPTLVVTSKTIDDRGYTDAGQALSELPAFGIQPVSAANTQASFGIAQSFVDFYALGSQRTLTLVNGRRFVSANTPSLFGPASPGQQVDLNVIPTKLIERIETISVGGAPIYGSDAIAGTVNIILKKDFQGLVLDGQGGQTTRGDAESYRGRVLAGMNFFDGRANLTAVGEFSKAHGLIGTDRRNFAADFGFLAPGTPGPFTTVLTPTNRVASISTSGIPVVDDIFNPFPGAPLGTFGVSDANGNLLGFAPGNSNLVPYNAGDLTGNPVFSEGGDGLSLAAVSNLLLTERASQPRPPR